MFQFPTFAPLTRWLAFNQPGCPIRKSEDQRLFASPPSLSQLITSFIASESQGIHRLPLLTFFFPVTLLWTWIDISSACSCYFILRCPSCQRSSVLLRFLCVCNFVWRITDSNRWPSACKADALASWANPPESSLYQRFCSPRQSWTADLYIISVAL